MLTANITSAQVAEWEEAAKFREVVETDRPVSMYMYDVARRAWEAAYPDHPLPPRLPMGQQGLMDAPFGCRRDHELGAGLFATEPGVDTVYYHPGASTTRAPTGWAALPGSHQSAIPVLPHGASAFSYDPAVDSKPRATLTLAPPKAVEPIVFTGVQQGACVCATDFTPFSLALELVRARNAYRVRKDLVDSGIVVLAPPAAKLNFRNACACQLLEVAYAPFVAYCRQFNAQRIRDLQGPLDYMKLLNRQFVSRLQADILTDYRQEQMQRFMDEEANALGVLVQDSVSPVDAAAAVRAMGWGPVYGDPSIPTAYGRAGYDLSMAGVTTDMMRRMAAIQSGRVYTG